MKKCKIKWYVMNSHAIIPTKTDKAAGFDIYATEDEVIIQPHNQHLFSTGLGYIISDGYWLMAFDRGSTGSKGLHVHCGVLDNDYRGEIFICIKNDNDYPVVFTRNINVPEFKETRNSEYRGVMFYPLKKAIAQLIPVQMPVVQIEYCGEREWEIAVEESQRKDGKLGSSGK